MAKFQLNFEAAEVNRRLAEVSGKVGASHFDAASNTMHYFASEEDLAEWLSSKDDTLILNSAVMNFTGTMYQVKVQSEMPSKNLYFTTLSEKAEITVSFASQKKGITDVSWMDIVEDYKVSVYIDKGSTGTFTPLILDQFVMSGKSFTFDVKKALATGANRVRVVAIGTESADKAQGSEVFMVNLTSMYLTPSNFTWYKPFIEGDTYTLGGVNIGGNLPKVLKIKVSKEGYEKMYEVNIGSDIYTTTAYVFKGMEFPEAGTGVYNVELWLDANGLESDHLSYNIICVAMADRFTAQLVAIGSPAKSVFNFADNKLFEYCVYNGGTATGSPHIKVAYVVNTNPTTIIDEDLVDVVTAAPLSYTASLEIEMEDESAALSLETFMTYGNEQMIVYPVDNSKSYPATTGATFYLNPSSRNNAQENKTKIINSINGAEIDAMFTRMAWTDGTDGWTTDDEGRKCLRLPAGCPMEMMYQPLSAVSQKTIEFVYKVKNAADYDEPIISICSDVNDPRFRGIKITPKKILIHSRDLNVNDSLQDYNTTDEETLHVLITIIPNYKTNYGNLAQIYVNGDKVRSFSFEIADRWDVAANVKIGSETADVFLYKMRVYDRGFEMYDALKNYINSLPSTAEKEAAKARIEGPLDDSYKMSYDECVKNGLNTMVIEILDQDQTVPAINHPSAKQCNLWINVHNSMPGELDEDFARFFSGMMIADQTIEGQGTTAMTYARWNFRWKLDSTYNKRRITAKKNFASSMHSHKMGATRLFNDLNSAIVGPNDADARVAVYQYPVYGFQKVRIDGTADQYVYEPIGLYTIGPDKGDKATFGFDGEYESTLIHLEGTDHTPKGVGMDYPWEELGYSGSAEALGAVNASGAVVAAWECGAAGDYDPKDEPTETKTMLDAEFKPAYDVAEKNSTYILGVTETLAEMNANISAWQARKDAEGRSYADLQFFTDGVYDLYFYNTRTQKYEPRGINMLTDLGVSVNGLTLSEKTELFKAKRRERFIANWETYWHKNDAIFHYAFVLLFGATDNFKKNTYPYKFKPIEEGGVYRWRQDDLDTLFDINNQGLAAKIYSILVGDKTDTGSGSIYRGDTSAFWTLIKECFPTEIKAMVHAILDKMVELSPYGNNTLEKLVGCVRYYFWDKAQAYFPASAYSKDAEWTYEDTWAAGLYKEVNPLQQSLGGHKEAEIDWVTMRMLFCAMYFNYGPFGAVNDSFSDTSTGQIAYGGAGAKTYLITMACDGNPTILRGQSELVTFGDRVKAGDVIELTVPDSSGADTRIYIQGVDWMEDIGDLSDLQVSADNPQLSVASKRLQRLKVGDEDAGKVTTNVQALNFGECPSMMIVDARNAKSLTGTIDLSKMPRLMEAYFGGTGVKAVNVPNGSKIAVLELGEETTQISLMNLKFMGLDGFRYSELPKLEFLRIENCSQLNPFAMLKDIYNTEGNVIRDIRIIGFDVDGDASDVTMIANLANDVDKDGNPHIYNGIDAEGKPMDNSHPVIEGRLRINGNIYEEDYEALKAVFSNLAMEFLGFYVSIKDPEVLRVLLANITTDDGVGLTREDIEGVTSLGSWFRGNTEIKTFDEFKEFIQIKDLYTGNSTYPGPFDGCTNLRSLKLPEGVTTIRNNAFRNCSSLEIDVNLPSLTSLGLGAFLNSGILSFSADALTLISGDNTSNSTFCNCTNLESVNLPSIITLGKNAFYNCTALKSINMPKVETIGQGAFRECSSLGGDVYLPELVGTIDIATFLRTAITSFTAPKLSKIGGDNSSNSAFGNCNLLQRVFLESIKQIGKYAFANCTALVECVLSEDITTIGERAFYGCSSLYFDELNLPNLESLSANALYDVKIRRLVLGGTLSSLPYSNGSASSYKNYGDMSVLEELVIPSSVTIIPQYFLAGYQLVKEVNLENIVEISGNGFRSSYIESAVLPNIVTMGGNDFRANSAIQLIDLGPNLTSSLSWAFNGCKELTTLIMRATTPPTADANTFSGTKLSSGVIFVPAASIPSYAAATNWSTYASRLAPLEDHEDGGYVPIADAAVLSVLVAKGVDKNGSGYMSKNEVEAVTSVGTWFQSNTEITSFDEFEYFTGVKALAAQAFYGCSSLESITIPASVSQIPTYGVFQNCSSLQRVTFKGEIRAIYNEAFQNCSSLSEINIPESVANFGNSAFYGCKNMRIHLNLPNVIDISNASRVFSYTGLLSINLPNVQKIGSDFFAGSTELTKVDIGASATAIGSSLCNGCTSLKALICRATTPPSIGNNIIAGANNAYIYVPDGSVDAYKAATNWSTFASRIRPLSEYTE